MSIPLGLDKLLDRARRRLRRGQLAEAHAQGLLGEDLAHRFLEQHGYRVVARNYRAGAGSPEADLVAVKEGLLIFVEVKTRKSTEFGDPGRAVDGEKQLQIGRAARSYVRRSRTPWDRVRFDVVSVVTGDGGGIELITDAFRVGPAR